MDSQVVSQNRFSFHDDTKIAKFGNVVNFAFLYDNEPPFIYTISDVEYEALLHLQKDRSIEPFYNEHPYVSTYLTLEEFKVRIADIFSKLEKTGLIALKGKRFAQKARKKQVLFSTYRKNKGFFESLFQFMKERGTYARKNLFFFTIPLGNPDRIVDKLYLKLFWLFDWVWAITIILISSLIVLNFFINQTKLIETQVFLNEFLKVSNFLWLTLFFSLSKIPHEFGHALAMRHIGRSTNEMGFGFMLFTPVLYVNVDELLLEKNKWKRFIVQAAGMYVDVVVTALACVIYFLSDPSSSVANLARLAIFANVGYSMIINLMPFSRFDGHHMLASLWKRQDLAADAKDFFQTWRRYIFGFNTHTYHQDSHRKDEVLLFIFSIGVVLYSISIFIGITTFFYKFGEPWNLGLIGAGFAIYSQLSKRFNFANSILWNGNK